MQLYHLIISAGEDSKSGTVPISLLPKTMWEECIQYADAYN